ncbi:hypothetical protein [Kitasatospora sp. CMC57]
MAVSRHGRVVPQCEHQGEYEQHGDGLTVLLLVAILLVLLAVLALLAASSRVGTRAERVDKGTTSIG